RGNDDEGGDGGERNPSGSHHATPLSRSRGAGRGLCRDASAGGGRSSMDSSAAQERTRRSSRTPPSRRDHNSRREDFILTERRRRWNQRERGHYEDSKANEPGQLDYVAARAFHHCDAIRQVPHSVTPNERELQARRV